MSKRRGAIPEVFCNQAMRTLFEAYHNYRGKDLHEICKREGIVLRFLASRPRGESNDWQGLCLTSGNYYEICINGALQSQRLQHFVLAHELGHYSLRRAHVPVFPTKLEYWEQECWCDSFALACVVSQVGFELFDENNYREFLQDGVGLCGGDYQLYFLRRILRSGAEALKDNNFHAARMCVKLVGDLLRHS